jgi:hypothetical protein
MDTNAAVKGVTEAKKETSTVEANAETTIEAPPQEETQTAGSLTLEPDLVMRFGPR